MIKVNYGMVTGHKKDRKWQNASITFEEYEEHDWYDDIKLREIRTKITAQIPKNYTLMGYAIQWTPRYQFDGVNFQYYMMPNDRGFLYIGILGNIDVNGFSLHKHGDFSNVLSYIKEFYQKLSQTTEENRQLLLDDLVFTAGRIPVEDVNKMITNTGYGKQVVENMLYPHKILCYLRDYPTFDALHRQVRRSPTYAEYVI